MEDQQCRPTEFPVIMEMFNIYSMQYDSTNHKWPVSTPNVPSATEELKILFLYLFKFSHI